MILEYDRKANSGGTLMCGVYGETLDALIELEEFRIQRSKREAEVLEAMRRIRQEQIEQEASDRLERSMFIPRPCPECEGSGRSPSKLPCPNCLSHPGFAVPWPDEQPDV